MSDSKIEWTEKTWNPVTGCTPVSEGCANCYAKRMANRLRGRYGYPEDEPFRVTLHRDRLNDPFSWHKPRRVFICSMGDLFHDDVPDDWIKEVLFPVYTIEDHMWMALTKRPHNALSFYQRHGLPENLWLGVSVENQARADERIPILLQIPAAVRFVSVEPCLGPVDLRKWLPGCWECAGSCGYRMAGYPEWQHCRECGHEQTGAWGLDEEGQDKCPKCGEIGTLEYLCPCCDDYPMVQHHPDTPNLSWVICGGETGAGAREMESDWARSLRGQCRAASVPFFFKKHGDAWCKDFGVKPKFRENRELDGQVWEQYPEVK